MLQGRLSGGVHEAQSTALKACMYNHCDDMRFTASEPTVTVTIVSALVRQSLQAMRLAWGLFARWSSSGRAPDWG